MSPDLQPPFPLQLFMPLQSCFSVFEANDALPDLSPAPPTKVIELPASNPVMADEVILVVVFIALILTLFLFVINGAAKRLAFGWVVFHHRGTLQGN